jgi:hypothetical protein
MDKWRCPATVTAFGLIVAGALAACYLVNDVSIVDIGRYLFLGESSLGADASAGVAEIARGGLIAILSWGLFLAGCALVYRFWSISMFGGHFANFALAATVVAVVAAIVQTLRQRVTPDGAAWPADTLTEAAATIKWCALAVAVVAVPAAVGIAARTVIGHIVARRLRERATDTKETGRQQRLNQVVGASRLDAER